MDARTIRRPLGAGGRARPRRRARVANAVRAAGGARQSGRQGMRRVSLFYAAFGISGFRPSKQSSTA